MPVYLLTETPIIGVCGLKSRFYGTREFAGHMTFIIHGSRVRVTYYHIKSLPSRDEIRDRNEYIPIEQRCCLYM